MEKPSVSVVIPYYKGERYVAEALESVFAQNYPNLEVIVVDDGSPKESLEALGPYSGRITLLSQENRGQGTARNTGIAHAKGEIIAFIDCDDLWPGNHLELLIPYVGGEHPYDISQGVIQEFRTRPDGTREFGEPYLHRVMIGSALYRKRVFDITGGFDGSIREGEDFDFTVRIEEASCTIRRIPEMTLLYRRHETNQTNARDSVARGEFVTIRKKLERARMNGKESS